MRASEVDVDPAKHMADKMLGPKFGVLLRTVNALLQRTGGTAFRAFGPLPSATVAQLTTPGVSGYLNPADYPRCLVYTSDEAGGATIAFSDGSDWRRVQDRNVVS